MPTITIQIGQYGNQLGPILAEQMLRYAQEDQDVDISEYFRLVEKTGILRPRSILVDTEQKVIQRCLGYSNVFAYDKGMAVYRQSGAGNNWAHGNRVFGPQLWPEVSDAIRREAEFAEGPASFLTLSSLGGGTGSGVSSYILERLADEYRGCDVTAQTVLPFMSGEVSTQGYNSVLSLAAMQDSATRVFVSGNDEALKIYQKSHPQQRRRPGLFELNTVLAHGLGLNLYRIPARDLFATTALKIYTVRATPSTGIQPIERRFHAAISTMKQILLTGSSSDSQLNYQITLESAIQKYASGRVQLFGKYRPNSRDVAGTDAMRYSQEMGSLMSVCNAQKLFRSRPCAVYQAEEAKVFSGTAAAVALNGMVLEQEFNEIQTELIQKLARRQFLWLYEKNGVELDEITAAAASMEQVLENYKGI